MKKIQLAALFSLVVLLAACGGGGSTSTTASTASVSGSVADGYLVNATVFLDKNLNYQLDAGEPSATTDANGAFTLTVDPNDVGKYPIVALAIQGVTVDKDTPNTPVTASYLLCIPAALVVSDAGTVSGTVDTNFVSPLSTLVHERVLELMAANTNMTQQQAMEQARDEIRASLGMDPLGNYLQGTNTNAQLHTMAQEMVALMMEQRAQIMNADGTNVNQAQYRTMLRTMNMQAAGLMQNASEAAGLQSAFMTTMRNQIMSAFGNQ